MTVHVQGWVLMVGIVLCPLGVKAEIEPATLHDARSFGMGGSGAAFIDSAAAIYHNPANLTRIDSFAATLSFSPTFNSSTYPIAPDFSNPDDVQSFRGEAGLAPFFLAAGAVRLHERVVLGFGAYLLAGTGGAIPDFPGLMGDDLKLEVGIGEFHLPVAVQVTEELSLSLGVRVPFGLFDSAQINSSGILVQEFTGVGYPGIHLGASYQPAPEWSFSFGYRSQTRIVFGGDVTFVGLGTAEGGADFDLPHQFRVGAAWWPVEERLLLAMDVVFSLYEVSNDVLTNRFTIGGVSQELDVPLNWRNALSALMGVEYWVHPQLALRAGWAMGNSSVSTESASPLIPIPGMLYTASLGLGTKVGDFEFGLGGSYSFGSQDVDAPTPTDGFPGNYSMRVWSANLTATYRHPVE